MLLSGGGARNLTLIHMIQVALPGAIVRAVDDLLLDADAKEAVAFAVYRQNAEARRFTAQARILE